MLEKAVGDPDVLARTPDSHGAGMHFGSKPPGLGAEIPRCGSEVPRRSRETKCQSRDVQMFNICAINEVRVTTGLDPGGVGINAARRTQVEPSARAFLLKPILALGVVEVLRLVFEVVAHVAHDDATGAAARPPAK